LRPPEIVWEKINEELDEHADLAVVSQLYDLQFSPPATTWDNIASKLDSDNSVNYPTKLYNLEIEPPVAAWENISAAIAGESVRSIGPVRKLPVFKYAAAAILVGLIAFGVKWLTAERTPASMTFKTVPAQNQNQKSNQPKTESDQSSTATEIPKPSNNLPEERSREELSSTVPVKTSKTSSSRQIAGLFELHAKETLSTEDFQYAGLNGNIPGSQAGFADVANRYLTFENSEGYMIRISKKLAEALGCDIQDKNSEEYQRCLEQIKKWRDRIANSLMTPSPDNFMDIFQLLKSTDEKKF
jgi:hypothetical protein